MASDFAMRIIRKATGEYVEWAPGDPIETMVVDALIERCRNKGVGLMRTEAHVLADVRAAAEDVLLALKGYV